MLSNMQTNKQTFNHTCTDLQTDKQSPILIQPGGRVNSFSPNAEVRSAWIFTRSKLTGTAASTGCTVHFTM